MVVQEKFLRGIHPTLEKEDVSHARGTKGATEKIQLNEHQVMDGEAWRR